MKSLMLLHKQTFGGVMPKNHALKLEWANKIELWKLSGKKARIWCRENQVVYTTFLGWRNRLGYNNPKKVMPPSSIKNQFIELKDQPKASPEISLEHSGIMIHLKGEFDAILLQKCLVALRGLPC
jgi:hypothetical protein